VALAALHVKHNSGIKLLLLMYNIMYCIFELITFYLANHEDIKNTLCFMFDILHY